MVVADVQMILGRLDSVDQKPVHFQAQFVVQLLVAGSNVLIRKCSNENFAREKRIECPTVHGSLRARMLVYCPGMTIEARACVEHW